MKRAIQKQIGREVVVSTVEGTFQGVVSWVTRDCLALAAVGRALPNGSIEPLPNDVLIPLHAVQYVQVRSVVEHG